jgi:hypothetical protein
VDSRSLECKRERHSLQAILSRVEFQFVADFLNDIGKMFSRRGLDCVSPSSRIDHDNVCRHICLRWWEAGRMPCGGGGLSVCVCIWRGCESGRTVGYR